MDIVDVAFVDNMLAVYRPIDPPDALLMSDDKLYTLLTTDKPCRLFDIDTDSLKDYKEQGEYKTPLRDMLTKYPVQPGDIVVILDQVRTNAFYVKSSEYLSLEPFVKLFKHYVCMLEVFTGIITVDNNGLTETRFMPEFHGIDERIP